MKVLIVDDEALAVTRLQRLLELVQGFSCVATASDGNEALEKIRQYQPDIVLTDIRMPDMDGIELVKQANSDGDISTVFIFTTAYEEHALEAYHLHVSGYLLKPINAEKLQQALENASKLVSYHQSEQLKQQHLTVSLRGNIELIPLENVRILHAEHKYVTVHHRHGEALLDSSLKTLEEEYPDIFKRVHRSVLVAKDYVESLEKASDGQYHVKVKDVDYKPLVSRRMLSDVRQWLKGL